MLLAVREQGKLRCRKPDRKESNFGVRRLVAAFLRGIQRRRHHFALPAHQSSQSLLTLPFKLI